jgi:peroxiredoxin
MRRLLVLLLCLVGLAAGPVLAGDEEGGLQVGDKAPAFSLAGSDGKTHSLEDHAGRRAVVVAWYPKAFTGG